MQKALVKMLLYQVGDKVLTATEREQIDDLFNMAEYTQVLKVIKEMSGGDDLGKASQIEAVSFGDN